VYAASNVLHKLQRVLGGTAAAFSFVSASSAFQARASACLSREFSLACTSAWRISFGYFGLFHLQCTRASINVQLNHYYIRHLHVTLKNHDGQHRSYSFFTARLPHRALRKSTCIAGPCQPLTAVRTWRSRQPMSLNRLDSRAEREDACLTLVNILHMILTNMGVQPQSALVNGLSTSQQQLYKSFSPVFCETLHASSSDSQYCLTSCAAI
jgi:hypothetical protein